MIDRTLKSLIQEELAKFISEATEHTDDEMVHRGNIDLQHEYDKLNRELFGGALQRIPLKWDNSKRRLGVVNSAYNRITGEKRINHLTMSGFYKITYRKFKDTLAHEMIHVKQILFGRGGDHGWSFYQEMSRINGMGLGYNIDVRNSEQLDVSDEMKGNARTLIAIIHEVDGEYFLSVTTPSVYESDFDFLIGFYERAINRGAIRSVELTVVQSKNPQLIGRRILRTFKKGFSYSRLPDNFLEELLNDNIIKSVKLKKGEPAQVSEDIASGNSNDWVEVEIS